MKETFEVSFEPTRVLPTTSNVMESPTELLSMGKRAINYPAHSNPYNNLVCMCWYLVTK